MYNLKSNMPYLTNSLYKRIRAIIPLLFLVCGCSQTISSAISGNNNTTTASSDEYYCPDIAYLHAMIVPNQIVFCDINFFEVNEREENINTYSELNELVGIACNLADYEKFHEQYPSLEFVVDVSNTIDNYCDEPVFIYSTKNYQLDNYIILVGNTLVTGGCDEYLWTYHQESRRLYKNG